MDGLGSPGWMGGALALSDALWAYRESRLWDPDRFDDVLARAGRPWAARRLGAISARRDLRMGGILNSVSTPLAKGVIDLEPGAKAVGPIDKRWRVRMNADLDPAEEDPD